LFGFCHLALLLVAQVEADYGPGLESAGARYSMPGFAARRDGRFFSAIAQMIRP
jgi:hypothetical protein